jgi:DNA-binding NarL/FixJ family response regulator
MIDASSSRDWAPTRWQAQRDVVELVVAGLSNRQIAEKLVMSVRTVEGHVYRACQRVGAQSREELASIMRSGPGDGALT